jgi:hypothetical protein
VVDRSNPEKRAQKCAGDFWFVIILSGAKKNVFKTKHKYKSSSRKRCQGKNKVFRKKSLYEIASNTPY